MSKRRVIPGFGLSMGFTIAYLSLIILIPLAALFIKAAGLGWEEWKAILVSPRIIAATRLTFGLSAAAAGVSVVTGLLVTWVLVRYEFPGKRMLDAMVDLPFALPTAVAGITLTAIYGKEGWIGSHFAAAATWVKETWHPAGWIGEQINTWANFGAAYSSLGIFIALTFIGFPFVVRTLQPVMEDLGKEIEEAAATLGAGRWTVFRRVILPLLVPALITGFTLAFARAIGEYGSVIFISGNLPMKTEILPLLIVSQLEQFKYGAAAVIASGMLIISFVLLFIINLLQRRLDWQNR
ncbi:MAG: sulfate ABC transporter permease subunit CysT [Luteolibacter sp.]|nr:sulfate ABC transporter permease subunit CysT [Luteolibacter sp.]